MDKLLDFGCIWLIIQIKNNPKILIKSSLIYNRHEAQEYISKLRNSNIYLQETMGFTQTDVYYNMKEESDESILQRFKAE